MKKSPIKDGGAPIKDGGAPSVEDQINAIGIGKFHYLLITMVSFLWMADGSEMVVLSLLSSTLESEWGVSKIEIGFLASAVFVGTLVGGLVGGVLGDRFGRRSTIMIGGFLVITGGVLSAAAFNLISLCIIRCVMGLGFGIFLPVASCVFAELVPTESRAHSQLFMSGIAWTLGEIAACLAALIIHKYFAVPGWWRLILLVCTFPCIIGLIMAFFFLPESPHYLCVQGRHDEVEAILWKIADENGRTDSLLQHGRVCRLREEPDSDWSWFQLFSKDLLLLTLSVSVLWSVCSFTYFGMTFAYPLILEQRYNMEFEEQYWAVMLAGVAEIPGTFLAMYVVNHQFIGRRLSIVIFFVVSAVIAVVVPLFDDANQFLVANMVLKAVVNGAVIIVCLFAVEIFPTTHRASGVSLCWSVARVAEICAPIALAAAITCSVVLTYQLVAVILGVGLLVSISIPYDTSNKRLATFPSEAMESATGDPERRPLNRAPPP